MRESTDSFVARPTESIRVLVVDDDPVLVRSVERVLRGQGFFVDSALDGATALVRLDANTFDVMLLDMQMANMDGLEVFRAARHRRSPPATIIHSAHVDVRTAIVATRAGVDDVLQKPVSEDILCSKIRELAGNRRAGRTPSRPPPQDPAKRPNGLHRLVGSSAPMVEVREHVRRVAHFRDLSVLVQGPTGTGKELVAQAIHGVSCPDEPFVSVNCAAVPESLFESELFGHEAGAFTNAKTCRVGLLEEAGRGTLFLDEVGEMPLPLQAKLLRVLEVRQFRRVGGNRTHAFSARVVSATNRPVASELTRTMRPDLYFRLAGYTIPTPALVEHLTDLPGMASYFLEDFARRNAISGKRLAPDAIDALLAHSWPGNVRELRAVIENACIVGRDASVGRREVETALFARGTFDDAYRVADDSAVSGTRPAVVLGPSASALARTSAGQRAFSSLESTDAEPVESKRVPVHASLPDLQRTMILDAFESSNRNLSQAAHALGIPRSTLRARLKRYGAR